MAFTTEVMTARRSGLYLNYDLAPQVATLAAVHNVTSVCRLCNNNNDNDNGAMLSSAKSSGLSYSTTMDDLYTATTFQFKNGASYLVSCTDLVPQVVRLVVLLAADHDVDVVFGDELARERSLRARRVADDLNPRKRPVGVYHGCERRTPRAPPSPVRWMTTYMGHDCVPPRREACNGRAPGTRAMPHVARRRPCDGRWGTAYMGHDCVQRRRAQ